MTMTGIVKFTMQLNNYSHVHILIATHTIKSSLFHCVSGCTIGICGCCNTGKSGLAWISWSCAEQIYWRNANGHCVTEVIIKNVIVMSNVACVDDPACNKPANYAIWGPCELFHVVSTGGHISIEFPIVKVVIHARGWGKSYKVLGKTTR